MARAETPPATLPAQPTQLIAWGILTAVAAALAVFVPAAGLVLVAATAVALLAWRQPITALGRRLTGLVVLAAIAGPNLALPQAPQIFAYRVLFVLLLFGLVAHLALGGSLSWPRALTLPASLLGMWWVWSAVSVTWADDPGRAVRWTLLLAMGIVLALMMPVAFGTRERAIGLLKLLGGMFVVVVLIAVVELTLGLRLPTSRLLDKPSSSSFAATAFFGNENNLATYLTITLPYFLGLAIVMRDIRVRLLGAGGALVALMLLLYTGSKTNLLATAFLLLALLVVLAADPASRRTALVSATVMAAGAAAVLVPAIMGIGPVKLSDRALSKFSFSILSQQVQAGVGSGGMRSNLMSDGINLITGTAGLGVGAGNADAHIASLQNFPGVSNLHNWWLEVTVNGGLIGLFLYALFFVFLMSRQHRLTRHPDRLLRYLGLAGVASLAGFIMGSLGPSSVLAFSPMWVMFGLCLTTIVVAARADGEGRESS